MRRTMEIVVSLSSVMPSTLVEGDALQYPKPSPAYLDGVTLLSRSDAMVLTATSWH